MPDAMVVANTSPILYLHLVRELALLPALYDSIAVPPAVLAELGAGVEAGIPIPDLERFA